MKKQILCLLGICAAFLMHAQMPTTENVSRLTSFEYSAVNKNNSSTTESFTNTYEYNEYGFVSVLNTEAAGWTNKTQYTYIWERPGVWNTCTSSDGTTTTRTFHTNGSVATSITKDASGEIKSSYEYDDQGKLTGGTIYSSSYSYLVYFAHLKYWFICTEYNLYQVDLSGNSYKHIVYNNDEGKTLSSVEEYWYTPTGSYICDFQESYKDGKLNYCSGKKASFEEGKIILTSYRIAYDNGPTLKAYLKNVYSDNYFNLNISNPVHEPNETYTNDLYSISEDGQETPGMSEIKSWVIQNVLKQVFYKDGKMLETPKYYLYKIGWQYGVYYDETARCYGNDEKDDTLESGLYVTGATEGWVYRFFDEDDNLLWTIKNHDEIYWSQQDPQTGEWTPCTGTKTVYNKFGESLEIECDTQGRMTKSMYTNASSTMLEQTTYTYTSDGYEYSQYKKNLEGLNQDWQFEQHVTRTSENGITTVLTDNGSDINKREYNYNTNVISYYRLVDNEWVPGSKYGMTTIEYLPDGNTYALTRRTMEGDAAVYYTKRIGTINPVDDVTSYTEYSWNKDTNDWEPCTKVETRHWSIGGLAYNNFINIYQAERPEENLYDYFRSPVLRPYSYLSYNQNNFVRRTYSWNKNTNAWNLPNVEGSTYEIEGGNAKIVSYNSDGTYTFIINSDGILLSETRSNVNDGITYQADYTFDSEGHLTKSVIADMSKIKTSDYTYSEIEILSGVKKVGAESALRYTGHAVEADGYIELYYIDGTLVASADDSIDTTSLTPGIYLAKASGKSLKIAVK